MSKQSFLKYLDEPLLKSLSRPKKFGQEPWRSLKIPQALIVVGDKRSGKDVVLDNELILLFKKFFTCIKIFDGGGHESLYYAVKKDCKIKWDMINQILNVFKKVGTNIIEIKIIPQFTSFDPLLVPRLIKVMEKDGMIKVGQNEIGLLKSGIMEMKGEFLHCECDASYPINVMTPPWIKPNKKEVDQFNGLYFDGYWEYNEAWHSGLVQEYLPENTDFQEIKKPKEMIKKIKPMIQFFENIIPTDKKNLRQFQETFRDIVLHGRENHRIVIALNTAFYPDTTDGKLAKYHTFGEIMYYLKPLSDNYFIPLKVQDTMKQQSWHKIGLFASELWKPVPDNQISPEPEASFSKKAFLAFMPTSRHAKTWVRVNSQSIGDVLKKSNKQQDLIIVKRSSDRNLGEELGWFKGKIEKEIEKALIKRRIWNYEDGRLRRTAITQPVKSLLISEERLSEVADLPDNRGFVINGNGDYVFEKWDLPPSHHKSDAENFTGDTNIHFKFDDEFFEKNPIKTKSSASTSAKKTKIIREKVLAEAHEISEKDNTKFPKIFDDLLKKYNDESDEGKYLRSIKRDSFSDIHRRYYPKE